MRFASWCPTFVGLVHLPRSGPTFFNCTFWAEYSPASFPGSLAFFSPKLQETSSPELPASICGSYLKFFARPMMREEFGKLYGSSCSFSFWSRGSLSCEVHIRICVSVGVRFLYATRIWQPAKCSRFQPANRWGIRPLAVR